MTKTELMNKLKIEMDATLSDFDMDGMTSENLLSLLGDIDYLKTIVKREIYEREPKIKDFFNHPFCSKELDIETYHIAKNSNKNPI